MGKWCMTVMVSLILVGLPQIVLTQDKPDQPEKPAAMEQMEQKAAELEVVRDTVAAGISDREPIDEGAVFSPALERIYYFTEIQSQSPSTEITHVWYHGDREVARVTLPVDGPRWRTWSSKQILPEWTGQWKVEAVTSDGTVVASQTFSVEAGPATTAGSASAPEPGPAREPEPVSAPEKN